MYRQEEECMMKKTLRQLGMAVVLASVFSMTACSSQVGKQAETTKAETGTSAESQEKAEGEKESTAQEAKQENGKQQTEEIKGGFSDRPEAKDIVYHPLKLTPEEEEAWKKEPAYGKDIQIGDNGGL